MPPGPSLPPKPYPEYGWTQGDSRSDFEASQHRLAAQPSRLPEYPNETSYTHQYQSYGESNPSFQSYDPRAHNAYQESQNGTWPADAVGRGTSGSSTIGYGTGLSASMDTLRQGLASTGYDDTRPPSPPLPTSKWHQQGEAAAISRARRYKEDLEGQDKEGRFQPAAPSSNLVGPPTDTSRLSTADYASYDHSSRPISTATGIISLYGDDWTRGSSSGSSHEEESRPFQSHRASRPLPAPPGSSAAALSVPYQSDGASTPGSFRALTPSSQHAAPQPYTLQDSPAARGDDYFDSRIMSQGASASSSANLAAMKNAEGPLWSPTLAESSLIDSPSLRGPSQGSNSYVGYHRPQYSLGTASTLSAASEDDGGALGQNDPRGPSSYRSTPHLRIDSTASVQSSKRRAPLPTLPSSSSHRSDVRNDYPQATQSSAPQYLYDQYDNDSRQSIVYPDEDESATPVQTTPNISLPTTASVSSSADQVRAEWLRANGISQTSFAPTIAPSAAIAAGYREEKVQAPRDRRSMLRKVNYAILSHLAVLLKDTVPRAHQVKGSISYPSSFTGKDIISTLQSAIPRQLLLAAAGIDESIEDEPESQAQLRRVALSIAQSLNSQLFFHEVDWGAGVLQDGVEQVYSFLDSSMAMNEEDEFPRRHMVRLPSGSVAETNGLNDQSYEYATEGEHMRNHPVLSSDMEELPTGVFVPLTGCYSPLCGRSDSPAGSNCYSPSCPRAKTSGLRRGLTVTGLGHAGGIAGADAGALPGMAGGPAHKAWAELMPKEVLDSLPKREVTRQNAILEHIQKEEDFLADLQLLETLFIRGLEKPSPTGDPPPIPIGPDRDDFIREVFANHRELVWHVSRFVEALHIRQREEQPIIHSIGDLFLDAALEWQTAFVTYVANYPIAKSRIGREQSINPRFNQFIETCRRDPVSRRLGLDNFIHRALPHLQRHPLLLQTIIDKTEEENPDRESCIRAKEIIVEQCKIADTVIQAAQVKAQIRGFAYNLQTKRNKAVVDMDLLNEERQLIHEGRVYRKPDFTDLEWTEMQAILFDNFFAVTKLKSKQENDQSTNAVFVLAKRPIAVELLEVSGFNEPSVSYSIGLNAFHLRSDRESRDLWPFTIHHAGGKMEPLTLYATSKQRRNEWRTKIDEAKGLRRAVVDANKAFETSVLSDSIFALPASLGAETTVPPMGVDANLFHGRITCAVPFRMADQRRLVALGCADGVWIGLRNDPSSFRKVLHLKHVTQCAVMEEFGIFIVLADKILISYSLEALVPSSTGGAIQPRPPQKLSGNRGVLFFGVGVLKDRTLLVYMKKKANESVFKALEPVINQPMAATGKSSGGLFTKIKNDMSKNADWFRMYKVSKRCSEWPHWQRILTN
ncbi:hypothetical protein BCV69DRAFT_280509 [Microstroma glucosiphilum]|uniref:DH domain-containing protein n=1 Tax=Pseudomicrostroma glucosiphilum TaxID=1684307 RepID=A0A316UES5_9BASI|nr:hypothetical protein BCV69DRAFT_280509 [Pseudomicrostroma glucosiphilum]PWN22901.1 hypothetical protein BCV69DRAFT_280509 [Pseudomicrostroma glucosiphilum]